MRAHVAVELILSVEALLADRADERCFACVDHMVSSEMCSLGESATADLAVASHRVDGRTPSASTCPPVCLLTTVATIVARLLNRLVHQCKRHAHLFAVRRLRCLARRPAWSGADNGHNVTREKPKLVFFFSKSTVH